MNKTKEILITGFALFSLFFGAGNLLLPPLLGYNAGNSWYWVTFGFMITAVIIPIFGIMAHAKLQGTMYDFGKKVSPLFSIIYCVIVYLISITIPSPRTAAATHEIAIFPNFETGPLLTSSIYFILVLVFVLNRSKILNLIGKYLTPLIVLILFLVIGIGLFSSHVEMNISALSTPIVDGILEGYQTFDAIGAVVVGGVIIISLKLKGHKSVTDTRTLIRRSGFIAGSGLFVIYAGLIAVGAFYGKEIFVDGSLSNDMQRATLLRGISTATLGNIGNAFLSVLISLACFTTAVGIITGTADYFKGLFNNSQNVYTYTAILSCIIGIGVGQLDFHTIIVIALPVLMFIYPITIVLIMLNVLIDKWASKVVFRGVVLITFLFSIPDVILHLMIDKERTDHTALEQSILSLQDQVRPIVESFPLGKEGFAWLVPALIVFILLNIKTFTTKTASN